MVGHLCFHHCRLGAVYDLCANGHSASVYTMIEIRTDKEGRIHGHLEGSTEELEAQISALLRYLYRNMKPLYDAVPYTLDAIRREEGHA